MRGFRQNVMILGGVAPAVAWAWGLMQTSVPDQVIGVSTAAVVLGGLKVSKLLMDRLWRVE